MFTFVASMAALSHVKSAWYDPIYTAPAVKKN